VNRSRLPAHVQYAKFAVGRRERNWDGVWGIFINSGCKHLGDTGKQVSGCNIKVIM
jgi:hypothetical protein